MDFKKVKYWNVLMEMELLIFESGMKSLPLSVVCLPVIISHDIHEKKSIAVVSFIRPEGLKSAGGKG